LVCAKYLLLLHNRTAHISVTLIRIVLSSTDLVGWSVQIKKDIQHACPLARITYALNAYRYALYAYLNGHTVTILLSH